VRESQGKEARLARAHGFPGREAARFRCKEADAVVAGRAFADGVRELVR
jgi:hypothetical protein